MKTKSKLRICDAGIAFIIAFILSQLTSVVGVLLVKYIMIACGKTANQVSTFFDTAWGYLLQAIFMNIAFIVVFIWYYTKHINKQDILNKSSNAKSNIQYAIICVLLGLFTLFALSPLLNYFQLLLDKLGKPAPTLSYNIDTPTKFIISLISMAVIPAICEELVFRGVMVNCLKEKGYAFAIIMSSIIFAMFHFSLTQLIYPLCFGIILSVVYLRTKNILYPMLLHFINNALTISIQYFSTSSSTFTHSTFNLIYAIFAFALWILAMYYFIKNFKNYIKNKSLNENLPNNNLLNENNSSDENISNQHNNPTLDNHNQPSNPYQSSIITTEKANKRVFWGSIVIMSCIYVCIILL